MIKLLGMIMAMSLVGCTPATSFKSGASDGTITAASTCVFSKPVDVSQIQIEGAASATPGQSVVYKLNQDTSCSPGQSVTWADAKGVPAGSGSSLTSLFSKPGQYVIAAQILTSSGTTPTQISYTTVVTPGLALNGPQVGMINVENNFSLAIPAGVQVSSVNWNFGDGSLVNSSATAQSYAYTTAGVYTINVNVTLASGAVSSLTSSIQVLAAVDGMECVNQLAISGPSSATVGQPVSLTLFVPTCVTWRVSAISWNFGDSSSAGTSQSVSHTYQAAGSDLVSVSLFTSSGTAPLATLTMPITVSAVTTADPGTSSSDGSTTTTSSPNQCARTGLQRVIAGELYTSQLACGVGGTKTESYRDQITQTCTLVGETLTWVETQHTQTLTDDGACQNQSCPIPAAMLGSASAVSLGLTVINGTAYMANGSSRTFYSSASPSDACSTVGAARSCSNGVLSGSTNYANLSCVSGCAGFGPNGTVKTGVVTGSVTVAHTCAFGETGINDIFSQTSDQTCNAGTIAVSHTQTGTLTSAGVCPTYAWSPTATFGACSANCGGTQARQYSCVDNNGLVAPAARCTAAMPVDTQVCDGNPAAVQSSVANTSVEEGGQSFICPTNQIGTITQERNVVTTTNYACINHQVAVASTSVSDGAWVSTPYCRDYVPYRCSQDSLSPTQALARYQWMKNCQAKIPAIQQFLTEFDHYESGTGKAEGLYYNSKVGYATFLIAQNGNADKVWIAPTSATAACTAPAGIYVAAVCTASCATPEQQIMAQADGGKLSYTPIVQAQSDKYKYVATLFNATSMNTRKVKPTLVDSWVTELLDGDHDVLLFTTQSGHQLKVTPNHPVLNSDGRMKLAADFVVGDALVRLGGELDPIVSIDKSVFSGKVYNLFTKSDDLMKNVVVTGGFLNGTAYFQNDGAQFVNKRLFQSQLVAGAVK